MFRKKKGYASVSAIESDNEADELANQSPAQPASKVEVSEQSAVHGQREDVVSVEDEGDNNDKEIDDAEDQIDPKVGQIPITRNNDDNLGNYKTWKICSLCGIQIHIHGLLPLFIFLTSLSWINPMLDLPQDTAQLCYLLILYIVQLWECILIHELGHALAGYAIGGHTDKILLWPLGGLAFTQFSKIHNFNCYDK